MDKNTKFVNKILEVILPSLKNIKELPYDYINISTLLIVFNLFTYYVFGVRLQWMLFIIISYYTCELNFMNATHIVLVLIHDKLHEYNTYYTVAETGISTMDEYWHIIYVIFLTFRLKRSQNIYIKILLPIYLLLTVLAIYLQDLTLFSILYTVGFLLAYLLPWVEIGSPINVKSISYFIVHTFVSLIITKNTNIGRFILKSIPAGAAFYGESIIYSILNDYYNKNVYR